MADVYIFIGPPGAGKGTLGDIFCEKTGVIHVSTGQLLRDEMAAGSELGRQVKGIIASGALVSDEIVAEMNRRDRDWLQTGVPPEVAYEKPRERLTDEERKTVDALQANGFRIVVRLEDGNARANIDLEVGPDNALWEMKNVGNGNHAVEDRMRDAYHKWTRLGLDPIEARTVLSSFGATREEALILADMLARMRYAREALYVTRGGGVRRIIKR